MTNKYHFVFPYRTPDVDSMWELKYAIRSLEKNFKDEFDITIIGDIPAWINTQEVLCIQYNNSDLDLPAQTKVNQKILLASNLYEDFFWIADDNYLIKPISGEELKKPRHLLEMPDLNNVNFEIQSLFMQRVIHTWRVLKEKNFRNKFNYCNHAPRFYNSNRIKEIHSVFNLTQEYNKKSFNAFIIENLYFNYFNLDSIPINDFRAAFWDGVDDVPVSENSFILNHNDNGILRNPHIISYLKTEFKEKSKYEL